MPFITTGTALSTDSLHTTTMQICFCISPSPRSRWLRSNAGITYLSDITEYADKQFSWNKKAK